jgi:hypothetical protein
MNHPDDPTRIIRHPSHSPNPPNKSPNPFQSPSHNEETHYVSPDPNPGNPDATRIIDRGHRWPPLPNTPPASQNPGPIPNAPPTDERTKLVRSSRSRESDPTLQSNTETDEGPLVGWLVVISGPGRGKSVQIGYGMNSIGRVPGNRVVLSFGDEEISRHRHATVTFDPRSAKFYIQHGESANLTYLGDTPVLSPMELPPGAIIRLGASTVLKFVPLCGPDFSWEEPSQRPIQTDLPPSNRPS